MNTKNNQRYRDMDKKLKSTLLELLKNTDFEKVTVKKLCETACVNRTTFYAHYADIYEMMGQMEEHGRLFLFCSILRNTSIFIKSHCGREGNFL